MKKNATVEDYMKFGADCKLLKAAFIRVLCHEALLSAESDEVYKLSKQFDDFVCRQEDKMFETYPDLPDEYLRVFYGPLSREPLDEKVDKTVIDMAKQTAKKLFER